MCATEDIRMCEWNRFGGSFDIDFAAVDYNIL